ncbi:MtrAB system accessory lipoprotein LpqB [Nocardia sp. BMG51109]|uniref:MtrAB system accessory lipoprotein LpqB n=1 Tax=Nocardia sp. BMG51109 TaxID=1056816 RepID=UPI000686BF29|nr:MtrAB system accessory lipoprotein LpqB [Nocardia sp. BMG51109]
MSVPTRQRRPAPRRSCGRWVRAVLGLALTGLLALTGCANLPDSSAPQALGTLDREPTPAGPLPPAQGRDPDLLLRDFLQATADPTNGHAAARQYLTPDAAASWDDTARTVIVEKPDTLRESRTGDMATYRIRARKIGELESDGSYRAVDTTHDDTIEMTKVGSEWRINELPAGVVMDSTAFAKSYRRYALNFANAGGTSMVPDLRWVSVRKEDLAERLLALLAAGPQPSLAPAVRNVLSGPVSVRGAVTKANGDTEGVGVGVGGGVRIDFAGASALDQRSKELLAAQVVLTLSSADVLGPYVLLGDGKQLDERYAATGWSIGDVNAMNPTVNSHNRIGLHVVRDGTLMQVTDNGTAHAPGYFGAQRNLESVGLTPDGQLVAAVASNGAAPSDPPHTLVVGSYDGNVADGNVVAVKQGDTFTRPSWTADGSSAWSVMDGEQVIRAVHDRTTGNVSVQDVDTSALFSASASADEPTLRGPITELRMSRTGTRAAIIAGGHAYVVVVAPQADGRYALTSPVPIASSLTTAVVSLDWLSGDTIMLAREGGIDPVETVFIDGSQPNPATSQNLTPPVRTVSASLDTQYIADSRAVMQLQAAEPGSERFWREVQGLGSNAIPVLPG